MRDNNSDTDIPASKDGYYMVGITYITSDTTYVPNSGSIISNDVQGEGNPLWQRDDNKLMPVNVNDVITTPQGVAVPGYQQGSFTVSLNNGSCDTFFASWSRIGNRVQGSARVINFTNTTASGTLTVTSGSLPYLSVQTGSLLSVGSCFVKKIGREPNVTSMTGTGDIQFVATAANSDSDILRPRYTDIDSGGGAFLAFDFSYLTDDTTWQPQNGATIND